MERRQDQLGRERQALQRGLDRMGQRLDIDRLVVVRRHHAQRRLVAHRRERGKGRVADRRGGRRGILRIERQQQDALAAGLGQRFDAGAHRRIAVAHRPIDHDGRIDRVDRGAKLGGLRAGDGLQRRFVSLAIPDFLVVAAFDARPARQNDGVEHELPDQPLVLDHPGVAEKLPQIAPHRSGVGGVRRAEIDDQHADPAARGAGCGAVGTRNRFRPVHVDALAA